MVNELGATPIERSPISQLNRPGLRPMPTARQICRYARPLQVDLDAGLDCSVLLHGRPGELDAVLFGPLLNDVGELACAVVGFVYGDLVQGRDGLLGTLLRDWFAGGPVVPGVQRTDSRLCG